MIKEIERNSRYYIDEMGYVTLTERRGDIRCDECGNLIGNIGDRTYLLRTSITVLDMNGYEIVLRCGKCRKFTIIKMKDS